MRKVLIAIDSFKGALSSNELAQAVAQGIAKVSDKFVVKKIPIADGGEGMTETLRQNAISKNQTVQTVTMTALNPCFKPITTSYIIIDKKRAVMELADIAGLTLIDKKEQNPLYTTTYGLGEMISDALSKGCRDFIIGIGGSATNDGGIGMLNALGIAFLDGAGKPLKPIGLSLEHIATICTDKLNRHLHNAYFHIACDVNNPLYGQNGAAHIYAKQKGAGKNEIELLDRGLKHFAKVVKMGFNQDIAGIAGAGAAGGIGAGFKLLPNSTLVSGIDIVFEQLNMVEHIRWADIIITGEGCLDSQTLNGKLPIGIAKIAKSYHKIVIALGGKVEEGAFATHKEGITALFSIMDAPRSLTWAMKNTKVLIEKKVIEIFRLIDAL